MITKRPLFTASDLLGNRRKLLGACMVLLVLLIGATWLIVNNSQQKLIEFKSRQIANVVANQATTARSIYTRTVVSKLKKDGFQASTASDNTVGAVPIPAQFLKALAHDSSENSGGSYQFRPLSKWNLSAEQGLNDDFQKWAWEKLEEQDRKGSSGRIDWEPIWRIEQVGGIDALRYLVADPASSQSCVDCHNAMEKTPQIRAQRVQAGVPVGKTWELNDLMGALEVIVPVHESSVLAASQTRNGLLIVLAVSLIGILLVLGVSAIDRARALGLTRNLEHQARNDSLTNLPNRAGFEHVASRIIGASDKEKETHAVMLLDLNDFKRINDTLGHHIGDEVLVKVAQNLERHLPGNALVSRLGGDEFAILIPGADAETACVVATTIDQQLDQIIEIDEYRLHSPASIGVAFYPADSQQLDELLRCADVAMYCSKRNRGGYRFYNEEHDNNHLNTLSVISDFKSALNEGDLSLVYQPKFNIRTGSICGVEALLRWKHPEFGMIPPVRIIPIAEQTGQIGQLTKWTLETGLAQLKKWLGKGFDINLAINLSVEMLDKTSTVDMILSCLRSADIPASRLVIEVTESAMMSDPDLALELITMLSDNGVIISLDDFGTGYSSLSQVHKLPLDELKLDRSFLLNADQDKNKAIIKTAIELAANLGLVLVAEGVEDLDTLALLYDLECEVVQGYLLSRPISPEEIDKQFKLLEKAAGQLAIELSGIAYVSAAA